MVAPVRESVARGAAYAILGNTEASEDVAQDALLIAYRSIRQLRQPARFGSWLYAIARHRALRTQRSSANAALVPLEEHEPQAIATSRSVASAPHAKTLSRAMSAAS